MTDILRVSNFRFTARNEATAKADRLGRLAFDVGPLHVSGVQLHRSADGRIHLSFRSFGRIDRRGRQHLGLRPKDDDARLALEIAIFTALRIRSEEAAR